MKILETEDITYNLTTEIGTGATCSVYKGYANEDISKQYAIKIYKEEKKKYFDKEISIHETIGNNNSFISLKKYGIGFLHHPPKESILFKNNEIYKSEMVYYKIEELAENGELFNYVSGIKKGFDDIICAKIFFNILKAVNILHNKFIIHGDIKPENIVVGNDFNLKLIDFGFYQKIKKDNCIINSLLGSDTYCSPEVRKANIQGYDGIKSDIFSLGVLLFVLRAGKFPFNISGYCDKRYRLIMNKNYEEFWKGFEKDNFSDDFKNLIIHLICYDPSERFSFDEIVRHPWIMKNINNYEGKKNNCNNLNGFIDDDVILELKYRKKFINNSMR